MSAAVLKVDNADLELLFLNAAYYFNLTPSL